MVSTPSADPIPKVAHIRAAHEATTGQRLLVEHTADDLGHCRACHCCSPRPGVSVWPCTPRVIGEIAPRIARAARPDRGSEGRT